ncbi:MAG: hypothetical protein ACN4GG_06605 [Akkermansiaceae bacterium]
MSSHSMITFPCPSCEEMISLTRSQAIAPCPFCEVERQAVFTVSVLEQQPKHRGPTEKGYHARCFRPDARPSQGTRQIHTPGAH